MNQSRSFDRAANIYDETRLLFDPIAKQGIQAILDTTGLKAQVLEVGSGTGRISIPLLERGLDLVGCDLSANMLKRLQQKSSSARIVQGDASLLPFPNCRFDFVMTVHVMHLVAPWREALREFQRVLRPGGSYLNVKTWGAAGKSIRGQIRDHWRAWLEARGVDPRLPGVQNDNEFRQELHSLGASISEIEVIRYPLNFTLREELERFAGRVYSNTWEIPEDVFPPSMEEVRSWVEEEYGDLDQKRADEVRFAIDIAHFKG